MATDSPSRFIDIRENLRRLLGPLPGNTVDIRTETVFTEVMTTTQTTQPAEVRCATCNQPYGHCLGQKHEWTPRFDRKAWVRLYDMRLGTGASMEAAARFANEHLGYPTGTRLTALGSVPRHCSHPSDRCRACGRSHAECMESGACGRCHD